MKSRRPLESSSILMDVNIDGIFDRDLEFVVETPNSNLHNFEGVVNEISGGEKLIKKSDPIRLENTIW